MKKELITSKDPKSPISEMIRTLRTNIQFMSGHKGSKSILVTSTLPSEGKSWVSANLAVTFAQADKKVVIIDADMRKGRLYNIFDVAPRPGLSNYLSGVGIDGRTENSGLADYIQATEVENLFIIPAGNVPPNPSELLVSSQMTDLINELKAVFDVIIFDGTPSLLVTDAIIISRQVDTSIIVSAYKETKMDNLLNVKKAIENVGGKVGGCVLNKIPMSSKKYDAAYYYGARSSAPTRVAKKENIDKNSEMYKMFNTLEDERDQKISDIIENTQKKAEHNKIRKQNNRVLKELDDYFGNEEDDD